MLAALAFLVSVAYWPGIAGAATSPRWIVLGILSPVLLLFAGPIRITLAHVVGVLFIAWALLTYEWSASPDDTIAMGWKLAILAVVFCLGSMQSDLRSVYIGMAAGLIPSGLIAIAQVVGWDGLPQTASPSGLFVNRNFYAEACALVGVALVAERLWWWLPAVAPGLLLTGARGALLAFIVPMGLLICSRSRWLVSGLALLALGIVIVVGPIAWKGLMPIADRLAYWEATANHLSTVGQGLGSFFVAAPHPAALKFDHPHNEFLEVAFETGWIGLALLLGFFATLTFAPKGRLP